MSGNQNDSSQNDALWHFYVSERLRSMCYDLDWSAERLVQIGNQFLEANKGIGRTEFLDKLQEHCRAIAAKERL